jgi:hypothetical protein
VYGKRRFTEELDEIQGWRIPSTQVSTVRPKSQTGCMHVFGESGEIMYSNKSFAWDELLRFHLLNSGRVAVPGVR